MSVSAAWPCSVSRRSDPNSRRVGAARETDFRLETVKVTPPETGQMLVRNDYLSLDPYMRGMMSDRDSYVPPLAIGETMAGATVGQIVESRAEGFAPGDWVVTAGRRQDYAVVDGTMTWKLDPAMPHKSLALGVLGIPGLAAWAGLMQIGKPKAGETLMVAAATGPVGSVVGHLARKLGLRVVGVAGGPEKCRIAVEKLGFDACIDHRAPDFEAELRKAVPNGIDIYFENVGGRVFRAVVPLLNQQARIPLSGNIVTYDNPDRPNEALPDHTDMIMARLQQYRVLIQGFLVSDYFQLWDAFQREVGPLVAAGDIRYFEDMDEGLEAAPKAMIDVISGRNMGKKVV
jgi:NADPH-dependent curcumin reductase CurA